MEHPLPFRRSISEPQFPDRTLIPISPNPNYRRSMSSSSSVLVMIQEWVPSCFSSSRKTNAEMVMAVPPQEKSLRERVPPPTPAAAVPDLSLAAKAEREYVWAYKYRPKFLNEFVCHRDGAEKLEDMVNKQQCGHFIFEGPPGVGKRTMALAFLRDSFGQEKLKSRIELRKIELKEEEITSIDVNVRISSQHIEINLSELRGYEKHVIVALINESRASSDKVPYCDHSNCRAIVIHEADKLSTDAQQYVRWIMEKYKGCNKIFFCCYDASKLQTIKHLCKIIKLQPPSDNEVVEVLEHIAKKECIELSHGVAKTIAKNSKHNLRQAIRSFEASWKSNCSHSFTEGQVILTGWEDEIANIARSIVNEQSPMQLYVIRGKLKKLIEHNVSPDFIFNILISELKNLLDGQFHTKIDALYQEFKIHGNGCFLNPEKSLPVSLDRQEDSSDKFNDPRKNVRYFMRIEEFTAKFMSFYKSVIIKGGRDKRLLRIEELQA